MLVRTAQCGVLPGIAREMAFQELVQNGKDYYFIFVKKSRGSVAIVFGLDQRKCPGKQLRGKGKMKSSMGVH